MIRILKDILYKVSLNSVSGTTDVEISGIFFDSRLVGEGSLFVATIGTQSDGHQFIEKAIEKGSIAIVCQVMPQVLRSGITYIQVVNSTTALGIMAANYYGNPSSKLKLVGVTGTNGKTTTVTLLHKLFIKMGYRTGMFSTVENKINEEIIPSTHTTPDAVSLNHFLSKMVESGCTHCFMEVSSHAVVQHRISGLHFKGAIFSNITHDHLDYHKTFDEYIKAKKGFFDMLGSDAFALVNSDDKRGSVMVQNTKANKNTFALKTMADFKAKIISNSFSGLEMEIDGKQVWFKLIGSFNAYNILAVYGAAVLLGEDKDEILVQLSNLDSARGRFERIVSKSGIIAIVDYAHTPDAVENVLETIKDSKQGKEQIITVIGCGGNRDAAKRPLMAGIATKLSDRVILTSDNPRDEEPQSIIEQMEQGVSITNKKKTLSILDRKEAIKTACMLAKEGDIILIAGKGHEDYQEIKGVKHHFDDKEIVTELFNVLGK
ncbi:MAG TPA: UDP-N-acetylmuramoyl-L-alanyl-D-glutamate--2,6-diaminopimelate ligase [Cytophagaceae bacterium]|jgi:UDP-N-acetylmuramoyl-L-alanyl-D-glutamate--2,6-diaminopimelate ligase|nr:UDP-N-acetylmuramoyl-L-alanyl-D-glutamate--2,6-diaminopimelate ligase [Cytophagaceae bacterium]